MRKINILLLIILVVACAFNYNHKSVENFKSETIGWGTDPYLSSNSDWDESLTRKIVGPNPNKDEVNNWQYNPENTQVDYKYYQDCNDTKYLSNRLNIKTSPGQNRIVQQLAPITWGSVGKNTDPVDEVVPVLGQETRVPDSQSNEQNYIIPSNPSLSPKYTGPNVRYFW